MHTVAWIALFIACTAALLAIFALAWASKVSDDVDKLTDHMTRPAKLAPAPPVGGPTGEVMDWQHPDAPVCPDHQLTEAQKQAYNRAAIRKSARESGHPDPFYDEDNPPRDGEAQGLFQQPDVEWAQHQRETRKRSRTVLSRDKDGNPIYLTDAYGNAVRDYLPKPDPNAYDPHRPQPQVRPEKNDS